MIEKNLQKLLEKFIVIHQTGDAKEFSDFERLSKIKESLPKNLKKKYILTKFVDPKDIGYVLQKADLVIGRSGMNTITELIYFKKPAMLIPLLISGQKEQVENALFLKEKGSAEVFTQNEREFFKFLEAMFANINIYKKNALKLDGLITHGAAYKIIDVIKICLKTKEETKIQSP